MFKEEYKKSMSSPLREGLIQETAEKMRAALAEPPEAPPAYRRRGFPYKRILAAAASFIIIAGGVLIWYRAGYGGGMQNEMGVNMAGEAAAYTASQETAMLNDTDGAEATAEDDTAVPQEGMLKASGAPCPDNGSVQRLSVISDEITPDGPIWGVSLASNVAELIPSNSPWTVEAAETIEALPVYLNQLAVGGEESENYLTASEMKATADSLLITLDRKTEEDLAKTESAETGDVWSYYYNGVSVDRTGAASISLEGDFSSSADSKPEQDSEAAQYYYQQAAPVLRLHIPEFSYTSGYSSSGQMTTEVTAYDKSGNSVEQITNYSVYPIQLRVVGAEDGEYEGGTVSFQAKRMNEYLGDYPILSLEEAGEKLMEGGYQTLDDQSVNLSSENIKGVTLTYCSFSTTMYFQPYYCFYVEIPPPNGVAQGLNAYIPCYVAAVQDEYLSGRTVQKE